MKEREREEECKREKKDTIRFLSLYNALIFTRASTFFASETFL
jgi:hypothetical protein